MIAFIILFKQQHFICKFGKLYSHQDEEGLSIVVIEKASIINNGDELSIILQLAQKGKDILKHENSPNLKQAI